MALISTFMSRFQDSDNTLGFRLEFIKGNLMKVRYYACEGATCGYNTYTSVVDNFVKGNRNADTWYMLAIRPSRVSPNGNFQVLVKTIEHLVPPMSTPIRHAIPNLLLLAYATLSPACLLLKGLRRKRL